jgi:hypothetical protein
VPGEARAADAQECAKAGVAVPGGLRHC